MALRETVTPGYEVIEQRQNFDVVRNTATPEITIGPDGRVSAGTLYQQQVEHDTVVKDTVVPVNFVQDQLVPTYAAPPTTYAAPPVTYAAPPVTYAAPPVTYAGAPVPTYTAAPTAMTMPAPVTPPVTYAPTYSAAPPARSASYTAL